MTMPRERGFRQVDVFGREAYLGNPLAVVMDGTDLSTDAMQALTEWTNLSEATFLLPPTTSAADYRVRIFCPGRELPFAGHPTLGTCHAWLEAGGVPRASGHTQVIVQECGAGLVRLRRSAGRLAFQAPRLLREGPLDEDDVARVVRALGIDRKHIVAHAWCDNGPGWRALLLDSAQRVLELEPNLDLIASWDLGVIGPWSDAAWRRHHGEGEVPCQFEVRAFFTGKSGLIEDPVTGSLNAALAQWLMGEGLAPSEYIASQGSRLGRQGRVHALRDGDNDVWLGGATSTCIQGTIQI